MSNFVNTIRSVRTKKELIRILEERPNLDRMQISSSLLRLVDLEQESRTRQDLDEIVRKNFVQFQQLETKSSIRIAASVLRSIAKLYQLGFRNSLQREFTEACLRLDPQNFNFLDLIGLSYSAAVLRVDHRRVLELCLRTEPDLESINNQGLANLAWSLATAEKSTCEIELPSRISTHDYTKKKIHFLTSLAGTLKYRIDTLSGFDISMILWSYCRLGLSNRQIFTLLDISVNSKLLNRVEYTLPEMTMQSFCNAYWSLVQWNQEMSLQLDIFREFEKTCFRILNKKMTASDAPGLGSIAWACTTTNRVPTPELREIVKKIADIFARLIQKKESGRMNDHTLSSVTWALSRAGSLCESEFLKTLPEVISKLDVPGSGLVVWCLGNSASEPRANVQQLRNLWLNVWSLFEPTFQRDPSSTRTILHFLWSAARLEFQAHEVNSLLEISELEVGKRVLKYPDYPHRIASFAWGFSKFRPFSPFFRELVQLPRDFFLSLGPQNLATITTAISAACTRVRHDSVESTETFAANWRRVYYLTISDSALLRVNEFSLQGAGNLIWAFVVAGFYDLELFDRLLQQCLKVNSTPYDLARFAQQITYSLSFASTDLLQEFPFRSFLSYVNKGTRETRSIFLWSLSLTVTRHSKLKNESYDELYSTLLETYENYGETQDLNETRRLVQAWMSLESKKRELGLRHEIRSLNSVLNQDFDLQQFSEAEPKSSKFHLRVSEILTQLGVQHENEYTSKHGLSFDVYLGNSICLEIDGPWHFLSDLRSDKRSLSGQSEWKDYVGRQLDGLQIFHLTSDEFYGRTRCAEVDVIQRLLRRIDS